MKNIHEPKVIETLLFDNEIRELVKFSKEHPQGIDDEELVKYFPRLKGVTNITVDKCNLGENAQHLVNALPATVTNLALTKCVITIEHFNGLFKAIDLKLNNLTQIDLSNNRTPDDLSANPLALTLHPLPKSLKFFIMNGCNLKGNMKSIIEALPSSLEKLTIFGNNVGASASETFKAVGEQLPNLTFIDAGYLDNDEDDQAERADTTEVLKCLSTLRKLKTIDFAGNKLNSECLKVIKSFKKALPFLKVLELESCEFDNMDTHKEFSKIHEEFNKIHETLNVLKTDFGINSNTDFKTNLSLYDGFKALISQEANSDLYLLKVLITEIIGENYDSAMKITD